MYFTAGTYGVLYFRTCSVLIGLSYIKGKVHENSMCQVQPTCRKLGGPVLKISSEVHMIFPVAGQYGMNCNTSIHGVY